MPHGERARRPVLAQSRMISRMMIRMTTSVPTPMYTSSSPFSREPPDQEQHDDENREDAPDEEPDAAEKGEHSSRIASTRDGCLELPGTGVPAVDAPRPVVS